MNRAAYVILVLVVVFCSALAGFRYGGSSSEPEPGGGSASGLYHLSLRDLENRPQSLDQWRGQVLVLNFWATWCPPCRREMPDLVRLSRQFAGKGVVFVGMSIDDADKVRAYRRDTDIPYPLLIGESPVLDLTAGLGNPTLGLPFTLVLDQRGDIAMQRVGPIDAARLEALLTKLTASR